MEYNALIMGKKLLAKMLNVVNKKITLFCPYLIACYVAHCNSALVTLIEFSHYNTHRGVRLIFIMIEVISQLLNPPSAVIND